jgi:extradiol dioxygenase family protein
MLSGWSVSVKATDGFVFLRVADAVEGHPQLLALFDREIEVGQSTTTLDHFAFLIDPSDQNELRRRFEERGIEVFPREFPNLHWRSFFVSDPEANRLEFVAYDPSVGS